MAIASFMLTLTALPTVIAAVYGATRPDIQFMGAVQFVNLVTADLSRMLQGTEGSLLTQFRHTPELHAGIFIQPIYALLGSVASFTGVPQIVLYHVGRILASYFMSVALYHLGANIWVKVRARRIFFVLAWLGGGTGLLWTLLYPEARPPDFLLPASYPFYAALINIDYPLTIGFVALVASVLINVMRPGFQEAPSVSNGGATLFVSVLCIALLYPSVLLPLMGAFVFCVVIDWLTQRHLALHEGRWLLWAIIPATPVGAYLAVLITSNPLVGVWTSQELTQRFSLPDLLLSNALLVLVGLPALWRAIRTFGRDVDRFMLVWLALMLFMGVASPRFPNTFLAALTLPLAYFSTRSIDATWLDGIQRAVQRRVFVVAGLLLAFTPLVIAYGPLVPMLAGSNASGALLSPDYGAALSWMDTQAPPDAVILASPQVSAWIPAVSRFRVVYGHPTETLFASARRQAVLSWYRAAASDTCDLFTTRQFSAVGFFTVDYALLGPIERNIGAAACTERWVQVYSAGEVQVYQCDEACRTGER